jgi:hypothetical protein
MNTQPFRQNFFSLVYFLAKTSVGFLLHPYLTMAALFRVSHQSSFPLTLFLVLTPSIYFTCAAAIWRLFLRHLVNYFVVANCPLMLLKTSTVFFALYWQLCLLYLFNKFNTKRQKGFHDSSS